MIIPEQSKKISCHMHFKWTLFSFANVENRLVLLRSLGESILQLVMIMMIMAMGMVVKGDHLKFWILQRGEHNVCDLNSKFLGL